MALKSYRLKLKKGKKKKPLKDIATAGITALIGVSLVGLTAEAVSRI